MVADAAPLRVAVVGTGALGRHHVRILAELAEAELVGIVDLDVDRARQLADEHGTVALASATELPGMVDAVVVAVPTVDHRAVAEPLLEAGLHVLVEKPIAPSLEEADALVAAAAAAGRILAVGHVEFYNPAVQALMALDDLPGYVEVQRMSVFTPRSLDVDVVLDLMIHDLQILHAIDPSPVREIRATGIHVLSDRVDIANVRLEFESGCVANLTASRVSAERTRKLRVFLHQELLLARLSGAGDPRLQAHRGGRRSRDPTGRSAGGEGRAVEGRAEPLPCGVPRRGGASGHTVLKGGRRSPRPSGSCPRSRPERRSVNA